MKIHIVQKGDTMWKLAEKYGVDFEALKKVNSHIADPDMIMPGMKIKVPTGGVPAKKQMPKKTAPIVKEAPMMEIKDESPMEMPKAILPSHKEVKVHLKQMLKGVSLSELKDLIKEVKPDWHIDIDIINQKATFIEYKEPQKMPVKEVKPFKPLPPPPAPKLTMPIAYQPKEKPIYHEPMHPCPPYPPSHAMPYGGHMWHGGVGMPGQMPYSYPGMTSMASMPTSMPSWAQPGGSGPTPGMTMPSTGLGMQPYTPYGGAFPGQVGGITPAGVDPQDIGPLPGAQAGIEAYPYPEQMPQQLSQPGPSMQPFPGMGGMPSMPSMPSGYPDYQMGQMSQQFPSYQQPGPFQQPGAAYPTPMSGYGTQSMPATSWPYTRDEGTENITDNY